MATSRIWLIMEQYFVLNFPHIISRLSSIETLCKPGDSETSGKVFHVQKSPPGEEMKALFLSMHDE